jgi:hypothetical protein
VEELVYKYLTKNYALVSPNELDEIVEKETSEYKYCLLDELVIVFGISKDESKAYADSWARNIKPKVSLVFYWGLSAIKPHNFVSPGVYTIERDQAEDRASRTKQTPPEVYHIYFGIDVAIPELLQ